MSTPIHPHRSSAPASSVELRRHAVVVDGIRTPLLEAGPPNADEAVVFVHGVPSSSEDWAELVAQVGPIARAIALDMPGFGQADKPADFRYDVDGFAHHLGRVIDHLGLRRVHLVGHDFGGPWALTWAAAHPERLASVTLMSTGVFFDFKWHSVSTLWRTPLVGDAAMAFTSARRFGALINPGAPRSIPSAFVARMYADFDAGTRRAILRLYRATPASSVIARSERQHAVLAPLDRPALVIWGRHDKFIPVAHARHQLRTFPSANVVILEESGHWPLADDPTATQTLILEFLRTTFARERRTT